MGAQKGPPIHMGASTWPPNPQRSSRPGKPGALLGSACRGGSQLHGPARRMECGHFRATPPQRSDRVGQAVPLGANPTGSQTAPRAPVPHAAPRSRLRRPTSRVLDVRLRRTAVGTLTRARRFTSFMSAPRTERSARDAGAARNRDRRSRIAARRAPTVEGSSAPCARRHRTTRVGT
jgi:hypothetical protein